MLDKTSSAKFHPVTRFHPGLVLVLRPTCHPSHLMAKLWSLSAPCCMPPEHTILFAIHALPRFLKLGKNRHALGVLFPRHMARDVAFYQKC